jgi:hypothetical protein
LKKHKATIACTWFDRHENISRYAQYSKVWNKSALNVFGATGEYKIINKQQSPPDFTVDCPVFHRGDRKIGPSKTLSWLKKIETWYDILVNQVEHGKPVLLCDVDVMFFKNPFPELEKFRFDVGYCKHNTGAVYFSGSEASRDFMYHWLYATKLLFNNKKLYQKYDKKYKGLDQASFGYVLENIDTSATVIELPRRFHSTVSEYELPCYIMHYHSALKSCVFGDKDPVILPRPIIKYYKAWQECYRDSNSTRIS